LRSSGDIQIQILFQEWEKEEKENDAGSEFHYDI
jgi:hypothetical protein